MSTATNVFAAGTYTADPIHSHFGFAIKHIASTFRATFSDVTATLSVDDAGTLAMQGAAKVESISITTPEQFRAHVLSGEFFDAAHHPEITFQSSDITLGADGTATLVGQLTLKGNTVDVTATGTYQEPQPGMAGVDVGSFDLQTTVNKNDLGLTWNAPLPRGGNVISDEVTLDIQVEFVAAS